MTKNPSVLDDAIPACLIDTMPWHEGTLDDVPRFLGMKEMGEHDPYDDLSRHEAVSCWIDRFSCRHCLIAYRSHTGEQSIWAASLGDCEGSKPFILFIP